MGVVAALPMILGAVGTAAMVVSGATQAAGIGQQARAQAQAAEFNAQAGQEKAGIQRTQTSADIERQKREARARQGAARAAAGASGSLEGSSLDILESNAIQEELDILNIKQQGAVAEKDLLTGARLDILESKNARASGKLGSAAAILGTTAKVANKYA